MAIVVSRVDLSGEHEVVIKTAFHRGRGALLSLSYRGAYIATDMSILPQATVRLLFLLNDPEAPVEAEAVVQWENRDSMSALPPGYGMRLTRIPPETALAIREIMKSAEVPSPSTPAPDWESSFTIGAKR